MDQAQARPVSTHQQRHTRANATRPRPSLRGLWLVLACTGLGALGGCQHDSKDLPDHLIGVWTTSAPAYADRSFELTHDRLIFGTGDDAAAAHVIADVEEDIDESKVLYTITYLDSGGHDYHLSFYYGQDGENVITFKHQQQLRWTKRTR